MPTWIAPLLATDATNCANRELLQRVAGMHFVDLYRLFSILPREVIVHSVRQLVTRGLSISNSFSQGLTYIVPRPEDPTCGLLPLPKEIDKQPQRHKPHQKTFTLISFTQAPTCKTQILHYTARNLAKPEFESSKALHAKITYCNSRIRPGYPFTPKARQAPNPGPELQKCRNSSPQLASLNLPATPGLKTLYAPRWASDVGLRCAST